MHRNIHRQKSAEPWWRRGGGGIKWWLDGRMDGRMLGVENDDEMEEILDAKRKTVL